MFPKWFGQATLFWGKVFGSHLEVLFFQCHFCEGDRSCRKGVAFFFKTCIMDGFEIFFQVSYTFMTCMVSGTSLQVKDPNFGGTQTVEFIFIYDVHFLPAPCLSRGYFPVLPCCDDGLPTWGAPPLAVQLWGVQGRRGSTA